MRFKAAQAKIAKDKEKSKDNAEDKASPEKSPAKSNNEHEGDNGHHKSKDPEVDEDEELTPRAKQSGEYMTPKSVEITIGKKTSMQLDVTDMDYRTIECCTSIKHQLSVGYEGTL